MTKVQSNPPSSHPKVTKHEDFSLGEALTRHDDIFRCFQDQIEKDPKSVARYSQTSRQNRDLLRPLSLKQKEREKRISYRRREELKREIRSKEHICFFGTAAEKEDLTKVHLEYVNVNHKIKMFEPRNVMEHNIFVPMNDQYYALQDLPYSTYLILK